MDKGGIEENGGKPSAKNVSFTVWQVTTKIYYVYEQENAFICSFGVEFKALSHTTCYKKQTFHVPILMNSAEFSFRKLCHYFLQNFRSSTESLINQSFVLLLTGFTLQDKESLGHTEKNLPTLLQ